MLVAVGVTVLGASHQPWRGGQTANPTQPDGDVNATGLDSHVQPPAGDASLDAAAEEVERRGTGRTRAMLTWRGAGDVHERRKTTPACYDVTPRPRLNMMLLRRYFHLNTTPSVALLPSAPVCLFSSLGHLSRPGRLHVPPSRLLAIARGSRLGASPPTLCAAYAQALTQTEPQTQTQITPIPGSYSSTPHSTACLLLTHIHLDFDFNFVFDPNSNTISNANADSVSDLLGALTCTGLVRLLLQRPPSTTSPRRMSTCLSSHRPSSTLTGTAARDREFHGRRATRPSTDWGGVSTARGTALPPPIFPSRRGHPLASGVRVPVGSVNRWRLNNSTRPPTALHLRPPATSNVERRHHHNMAKKGSARHLCGVLQSVLAAAALYASLYLLVTVYQKGSLPAAPQELYQNPLAHPGHADKTRPPGPSRKLMAEKVNPHANWFNRPESRVVPRDNYLGPRPPVDTLANLTRLVEECRGSYEHLEKVPFVQDCLRYLAEGEKDYLYQPGSGERASEQPPAHAEYLDADGAGNTLGQYPRGKAATKGSRGRCPGPIVPYHVYWTGPATWRVELFIKSHLHTQNIPCVRLLIWLDGDRDANAVDKMLSQDPGFEKFLPLVARGDIVLKTWRFPSRIPLPRGDNTDGRGYYKAPGKPNPRNETLVADGLLRDASGQEWLVLTEKQMTFLPVAVSDAVRFVVLHLYGGAYFDMDVVMLRDLRPLLIGDEHAFAERWAGHPSPGDYNTAIMSLSANSSLSSYLLRGGVRMGLNFHPRVIGVMAVKDQRNREWHMLETAAFDPIWTAFNWGLLGRCTVPCIHDYSQVFKGRNAFPLEDEWKAYDGPQLEPAPAPSKAHFWGVRGAARAATRNAGAYDRDALSRAEYRVEEDQYPPTNRTMENFFRGAWTYHIHNQWLKNPEPSSWLNVIQRAHDGFFSHGRMNPYGETWDGPRLPEYEVSWEYP
ncbi:snoRNA binding protein [Marssonina coronariae]|uniref:SnoRNA binding protein n=1 Tax=Diplocarpon coronariae TaxID=2795749 RepID=A0A218YUE2_9HELO|nr:snoRNA binding protein [Marssonina coronariae]